MCNKLFVFVDSSSEAVLDLRRSEMLKIYTFDKNSDLILGVKTFVNSESDSLRVSDLYVCFINWSFRVLCCLVWCFPINNPWKKIWTVVALQVNFSSLINFHHFSGDHGNDSKEHFATSVTKSDRNDLEKVIKSRV